ncbi:peptidoglycan-binding protein LysM [Spirochaetia bacterium]|nr:peptidoglycan-binding protein LysM [Spirochaetia bacterium]
MAASIGIKEANGGFYAILEENSAVKKRLVLTTVHDNQKSVQIDLYKSQAKSMADAMYIGSIVVENISLKAKGEPSIEMLLSSTKDGSINADAVDLGNPSNEHHLSVSLKSFEEDKNEYPDFDIDDSTYKKIDTGPEPGQYSRRKFPWLVIIIIGIVLALACLGVWFFLFRNGGVELGRKIAEITQPTQPTQPAQPAQPDKPAEQPAAKPAELPAQEKPVAQAPAVQAKPVVPEKPAQPVQPVVIDKPPKANPQAADRQRPSAPVYSFKVPQTIPPEGFTYKVRWGDTLWDISEAFYRNPRLYTFIVRSNELLNPNLIVSGTELTILPRN